MHLRFDRLVVVDCEPRGAAPPAHGPRRHHRGGRPRAHRRPDAAGGEAALRARRRSTPRARLAETDAQVGRGDRRAARAGRGPRAAARAFRWTAPPARCRRAPAGRAASIRWRVLDEIASAGALDMARMAASSLRPRTGRGTWPPRTTAAGEGPETLAIPVALWSAGGRPGRAVRGRRRRVDGAAHPSRSGRDLRGRARGAGRAARPGAGDAPSLSTRFRNGSRRRPRGRDPPPPHSAVATLLAAAGIRATGTRRRGRPRPRAASPTSRARWRRAAADALEPELRARVSRVLGRRRVAATALGSRGGAPRSRARRPRPIPRSRPRTSAATTSG